MTDETAHTVHSAAYLDSRWMRLVALAIVVAGVALFIIANPDVVSRWFPTETAAPSPYQACLDERTAAVEGMAREAGYTAKQKELAVIRAEEFCRNQPGT